MTFRSKRVTDATPGGKSSRHPCYGLHKVVRRGTVGVGRLRQSAHDTCYTADVSSFAPHHREPHRELLWFGHANQRAVRPASYADFTWYTSSSQPHSRS